jgi:hypothetical protein
MNYKQFKAVVGSVFVARGYTNVKSMFFRRIGEVFTIVDLQKSDFGGRYYINIGLFVDESGHSTQPPPFHKTHLKQRLASIVPQSVRDTLVPATDLEVSMSAAERSTVLTSALEQYAVPYLDSLSTVDGIADYLTPEAKNFAGVTLALRDIIRRRTGREQPHIEERTWTIGSKKQRKRDAEV